MITRHGTSAHKALFNCWGSYIFCSVHRSPLLFTRQKIPRMPLIKHPSSERWDLEFGSNTTEKFEISQVDMEEMLEPRAEVEARVVFSVRLHMLHTPTQKLKEE